MLTQRAIAVACSQQSDAEFVATRDHPSFSPPISRPRPALRGSAMLAALVLVALSPWISPASAQSYPPGQVDAFAAPSATPVAPQPYGPAPIFATHHGHRLLSATHSLDLSTIGAHPWMVNGQSVAYPNQPVHRSWNLPTGHAQWVSSSPAAFHSAPRGVTEYRMEFPLPACRVQHQIRMQGVYGGDDNVRVLLRTIGPPRQVSSCGPNGWCFNTRGSPPGIHWNQGVSSTRHASTGAVIVQVQNVGGGTGMFVNARLYSTCPADQIHMN